MVYVCMSMDALNFPSHLSEREAQIRLKSSGPNELPRKSPETIWHRLGRGLQEPMLLLLVLASVVYLLIGDLQESLLLGFSVFVVIGISLYQDYKSENALAALQKISSPRALVIRDNVEKRISSREVVPGDLVVLHEGDRVAADGVILRSTHLMLDESLLTGESFAVKKSQVTEGEEPLSWKEAPADTKVYSSTLIVAGSALMRVHRTGAVTEVGKIGKSLLEPAPVELNLTKEIARIVRIFAWSGSVICAVLIIALGLTRHDWLQAFLVGLATQMSLLPEEFPVILTVFMAMGAWRLSQLKVLVRKPVSIERLGAITALCVDKTGTLTLNQMRLAAIGVDGRIGTIQSAGSPLAEEFHPVLEYGVLASHRLAFDPMEKALLKLASEAPWAEEHLHPQWKFVREYPLSNELPAMSCAWQDPADPSMYVIASKGAPESVIDLCHLTPAQAESILNETHRLAQSGYRVLGVAKARAHALPPAQHDFSFEWIGLLALEDPLRPEVPSAVALCRSASIRVLMLTGDHAQTAAKIAKQAGIDDRTGVITGAQLEMMSDSDFTQAINQTNVFARMVPEQKLRLVKALKEAGHTVAMTGDGVNDAPSLRWADVGISMGSRGTDVAREASDIVLLDDNFASIVAGIEQGRMIFLNIKKAMNYIVSVHIPIAGLAILPVFLNWPIILYPAHIVFLELIIDPVCSLIFESPLKTSQIMHSPPRSIDGLLFSARDYLRSGLQGLLILAVTVIAFGLSPGHDGANATHARSLTFILLILSNLGLIFADLSGGSWTQMRRALGQRMIGLIPLVILTGLFLVTHLPWTQSVFHLAPVPASQWGLLTLAAIAIFMVISFWNQLSEFFQKRRQLR